MVVATGAVVLTIATAGAATPMAVVAGTGTASTAGVTTGVVVGSVLGGTAAVAKIIGATSTIATVASSGIAGAAFGAIGGSFVGTAAGSTGTGAVVSGTVGALTALAVSSNTAGATGLATYGFLSGPIGMCVLGADVVNYTFDCWKKVVHDTSEEPSDGKVLFEFVKDDRIKHVCVNADTKNTGYPEITMVNIWDEQFLIEFYYLPLLNKIAAHAKPVESTKNLIL